MNELNLKRPPAVQSIEESDRARKAQRPPNLDGDIFARAGSLSGKRLIHAGQIVGQGAHELGEEAVPDWQDPEQMYDGLVLEPGYARSN